MHIINRVGDYARFADDTRRFLRDKLTPEQALSEIERRLTRREQAFMRVIEEAVYARPQSTYAQLLQHAGIELDDVRRLVNQLGVEGALGRLYEAGVYVSVDELKGRRPLKRGSLELETKVSDFNSPFITGRGLALISSGSTGASSRVSVDFRYATDETISHAALLSAHGLNDSPAAYLGVAGLTALYFAKLGHPLQKYFSIANTDSWLEERSRAMAWAKLTVFATQLAQRRFVQPEFSQHDQSVSAVHWLAEQKARGTPAYIVTLSSPAVRLCQIALERGLDISGTAMRMAGEPYTEGKAQVVERAGVKAMCMYVSVETGVMGVSCATPSELDDVHFFTDRFAIIQRDKQVAPSVSVGALAFTTLALGSPLLLLNAESGDYATMERRSCGCLLNDIGLTTHLSGIRSYEKLTSEGVTFIGSGLHDLVEQVLPARFGGSGSDYQLVEEEEDGRARVSILVAPGVGAIDEAALIGTVMQSLQTPEPDTRLWTQIWSQEKTLRVIRREPYRTHNAKVLPLHILRPDDSTAI